MSSLLKATNPILYERLGMVMRGPKVRAKVAEVADRIEERVKSLAEAEDHDAHVIREDGTRPGDKQEDHAERPFSRVAVDGLLEHGGPNQTRLRVLGRAIAGL